MLLEGLTFTVPWSEVLAVINTLVIFMLRNGNKKLQSMLDQTKNNGGSTIKDQIDRIESSVASLTLWIEAAQHLTTKTFFKTDPKGNFIWTNTSLSKLLGMSLDEMKDMGWMDVIADYDYSRVRTEWEKSVETKGKFNMNFSIVNPLNEETKKVSCKAFPIIVHEEILGYLGSFSEFDTMSKE